MVRRIHKPKKVLKKLTPPKSGVFLFAKILAGILLLLSAYNILFIGRILPNVSIAGVDVSGLTPEEAQTVLSKRIQLPTKILLVAPDQEFELDLNSIELHYDEAGTTGSAYNLFRTGNFLHDTSSRIEALWRKRDLGLKIKYNQEKLDEFLSVVGGQLVIEEVAPKATYVDSGVGGQKEIIIDKGSLGQNIDLATLRYDIGRRLSLGNSDPITLLTIRTGYSLTEPEAKLLKERSEKFVGKKLTLSFEFQNFGFTTKQLLPLLDPKGGYSNKELDNTLDNLAKSIEREPQNPTFEFSEGRVKEFAPAKPGVEVDREKTKSDISQKLQTLETTEEKEVQEKIAVRLTESSITTDSVNDLGIKELIGRGTSTFRGSIASRIYNVSLASTRLNGVLVKPGEEFSFNEALGDVSKLTGYKEAYVIKDGKTVLGDGGGVCQVSTTLFRAVLNAGLPITERRAHAYRVGYYEQDSGPGLDATVYSPTTDLKFKNDTPGHILIQTYPDTNNLTLAFELYGTSDERSAKTTKPITSGVTPPPEDLYQDDPTLPAGTIKQIEHKAWGAKSVFNYTVERQGSIIYEKTFVSNYRPWQAVYLRGTGPAQ